MTIEIKQVDREDLKSAFRTSDVPAKNIALRKAYDAIGAYEARIAELERERDEARSMFDKHVVWASEQAIAAEARLAEAVEVIRPFAEAAEIKLCGDWRDDQRFGQTDVSFHLNFGHLRRAARFIQETERG